MKTVSILFFFAISLVRAQEIYPAKKELWGYANASGKVIIDCEFDFSFPFFEEKAVVIKDGKYGVINSSGNWIIEPSLDYIDQFQNGIARARLKNKYGFINAKGNWVIQPIWDHLRNFKCGLARSFLDEKYGLFGDKGLFGYIDTNGNIVVDNIYSEATDFHENHAVVTHPFSKSKNYVNRKGELVFKGGFNYLALPKAGYAEASIRASSHRNILGRRVYHGDAKFYRVDTTGNKYSPKQFDSICEVNAFHNKLNDFENGLCFVYKPYYGFCDYYGKQLVVITDKKHRLPQGFNDGLTMVYRNYDKKKFTFLDRSGKQVGKWIKCKSSSSSFQNKRIVSYKDKNWKTILSDIWGNTIADARVHEQYMTDGIIISYTDDNPTSSIYQKTNTTVHFLNPDLSSIAKYDTKATEDSYNRVYWNEYFTYANKNIVHLSSKGLNGVNTGEGWLYFEVNY